MGETNVNHFGTVIDWLDEERATYQTKKFDYEEEVAKDAEYWEQQFDSYIQRLLVFPMGSLQFKQAALKLAATAVALAEHQVADGLIPKPGLPSGELEEWE